MSPKAGANVNLGARALRHVAVSLDVLYVLYVDGCSMLLAISDTNMFLTDSRSQSTDVHIAHTYVCST